MSVKSELRSAMSDGDADAVARIYDHAYPNMPKATQEEAAVVMHTARTASESMPLAKRLYSHAWLTDRGFRSQLPEELRPRSERVESVIVPAVGVAVSSFAQSAYRKEEAKAIERVMARAAGDMVRDGITDRARIAPRMWEARELYLRGKLRREI